ncbi:hypothetical protein RFI_25549, partial [Reticulomyxa filosa]
IVSEDKDNFTRKSTTYQTETQDLILENTTKDQNKDTEAKEDIKENEGKLDNIKNKGFGPGINLQGYCTNKEGNIIRCKNPASCDDFASLLQESRKQEIEDDTAISQGLETYISLEGNNYAYEDSKDKTYNCHQRVLTFLEEEEKNEKQEQQSSHKIKKK